MKSLYASSFRTAILFLASTFTLLLLSASCRHGERRDKTEKREEIYAEVDRELELAPLYQQEKEKRIDLLRGQLSGGRAPDLDIAIYDRLIEEYESYQSDSALRYVNLSLENPRVKANPRKTCRLLLKKADILSHAGLFSDAEDILDGIRAEEIDSINLEIYYNARVALYRYLSEYMEFSEYARESSRKLELYTDSLLAVTPPTSMNHIASWALSNARNQRTAEVRDSLIKGLETYKPGDHDYSILASILAYIYHLSGDEDNHVRYLALSTISDLKGVVKENMAIRELATICYEEGDIERANHYLKHSFADANFYAARMRNAQSSKMLPVIDEAYTASQQELNHRLTRLVVLISILAAILLVLAWFAVRQLLRARRAKEAISKSLEEQSVMSERFKELNLRLEEANASLQASNILREEYAGLFMEYCSLAISGLQQYHQSLRVMATTGNIKGLLKKIDSTDVVNKTLHDFYDKFDEAILNLYPDFAEKLNALLRPGEQVVLKAGEQLNTELRIFALIRIGITDSEKIARFLRCSLSTVYTYRSRLKSRAVSPETFEEDVCNIF